MEAKREGLVLWLIVLLQDCRDDRVGTGAFERA